MTTATELIQEVRKIAAERPDFVYGKQGIDNDTCSYFGRDSGDETGSPCIIGQALKNLGVNTERLRAAEYASGDTDISTVLDSGYINISCSDREAMWLQKAQTKQDFGYTWAKAVEEADKWVTL